jgi:hypothetical protein
MVRIVVPVNHKENPYTGWHRDLVGAQKPLEQRNASPPLKILVAQRLQVCQRFPAVPVERILELPEGHHPALGVEMHLARLDLDHRDLL